MEKCRFLSITLPKVTKWTSIRRIFNQNKEEVMSVKYSEDHAWVKVQDEGLVAIGITDFAQEQLGDLVYIELPKIGYEFSRGDNISVIESVKSASDLVAPVSGEIVEVNDRLEDDPELVSDNPMDEGWFIKVKLSKPSELDELMDEKSYQVFIED